MQGIPSTGQVVGGKYRVLELLGQGGMGAVLAAEHEITHKRVAIKWMHPQIAGDSDTQARFVREAQASARVRHPNIVDVYDVVREGDAIFLVMELLEGETLTALLERGGMPIHKLIELLLPALRAIAAAHRQGVIHRDLKPDNIFLARQPDGGVPVPKVLDFGISKVVDTSALALTRTGAAMGTPMYMSLEQLCGEKDIDARADVYALGVILYEAITGRAPFDAETFSELAIKVATVEPSEPKAIRPELPAALAALVSAAMAKKRENRTSSVDELIRQLQPFASEQSFRAKMTHPQQPMPAVRGESEPPPALERDAGREPRRSAIPLSPARSVEASPTYSKANRRGKTRLFEPGLARLVLFGVLLVLAAGVSVSLLRSADDASTRASEAMSGAPLSPPPAPPAVLAVPEPQPLATPVEQPASARETAVVTPVALPLAPKTLQHGGSASAPRVPHGFARDLQRSTDEMRVRDAKTKRQSALKRAGKARLDDF